MSFRKLRWFTAFTITAMLLSACNIGVTPPAPTEEQDNAAIQTQAEGLIFTQAAEQATQTAAAIPPSPLPTFTAAPTNTLAAIPTAAFEIATNTPFTFNTQQPGLTPQAALGSTATAGAYSTIVTGNGCTDGYLISESAPYDGKKMNPNQDFSKSWEFLNTGTCNWDGGFVLGFVENAFESCNGPAYVVPKEQFRVIPPAVVVKPGQTYTYTISMYTPKDPGDYKWCFKMKDDAGQYFGSLVWMQLIVE